MNFHTFLVVFRRLVLLAPDLSPGRVWTTSGLVVFRRLVLLAPDLSPGRVWTTSGEWYKL